MHRLIASLALAAVALAVAFTMPPPQQAHAARPVLSVCTEGTYPPYSYRDAGGQYQGFDIEVVREVADRIGMVPDFQSVLWEDIIETLRVGDCDVIASSMAITPSRKQVIDFSIPYMGFTIGLVARHGGPEIPDVRDANGYLTDGAFAGVRVGVQRATAHDNMISTRVPWADIYRYDDFSALRTALDEGVVDVILIDNYEAHHTFFDEDGGEYYTVGEPIQDVVLLGDGVGFGVRYQDEALKEALNEGIASMQADGTLSAMLLDYFGVAE